MSFTTELLNKKFEMNVVIDIDGKFYSIKQVDSDTGDIVGTGSGIEADKIGTVKTPKINPINVDLRNVRTTVQTATFGLVDLDQIATSQITGQITSAASGLLEKTVNIYVGFITGSFDLGDYLRISKLKIKKISRVPNEYRFTCTEITDEVQKEIFDSFDVLDGAITDTDTTVTVVDPTIFPIGGGRIRIDDEFMQYTAVSGNDLTGVSRGDISSTAVAHSDGADVFLVTDTGNTNPIDLMLQIMVSPGGGGSFDVLSDGMGISESDIDVTSFTDIRDNNFASDLYQFFLHDIGNGLKFLEDELMAATNTRIFAKNGKIALALLDQVDLSASVPTIDESTLVTTPSWALNSDKVVNQIVINYDFNEGLQRFTRSLTVDDTESQTVFGLRKPLTLNFKGVRAALSGSSIASDRANRLLLRLATPRAEIGCTTHFDQAERIIGENVVIQSRFLPTEGGSLGISDQVEILSKSVNFSTGQIRFKLNYTSYAGLRVGVIAPSPLLTGTITSQKEFDVPDGDCYNVGDILILFDSVSRTYLADPPNTIVAISGNTITMANDFTTTLGPTIRLKFVDDYDQAANLQRARFAFIVPNTNEFADGTKGYQITA